MANNQQCIYLRIQVKPGGNERHKIENFGLDNTVTRLKLEAGNLVNVSSDCLELIHHGKVLKDNDTLQDSGVKIGETVHVIKKNCDNPPNMPNNDNTNQQSSISDAELQEIVSSLRAFGTTPSAPGWTRALQVLDDDSLIDEIEDSVPSLLDDPVSMSFIQDMDLVSAVARDVDCLRRASETYPNLPQSLSQLIRIIRSSSASDGAATATPGFAYSLEALSEDEDGEDDDEQPRLITEEHLAAALRAASAAVASSPRSGANSTRASNANTPGSSRSFITPDMFSSAISQALSSAASTTNAESQPTPSPMEQSTPGTPTAANPGGGGSGGGGGEYTTQLERMHEMGLLDDAVNLRALMLSAGDVNAAINLVFSGAIDN